LNLTDSMEGTSIMARATEALKPISTVWEWQMRGRCRGGSGSQFFHPDEDLGRISRKLREAAAKRVCGSCPVRAECAAHALAVGEDYGVWGGFTERERNRLRDLGWQDAVENGRRANVSRLERRLAVADAREREERTQTAA